MAMTADQVREQMDRAKQLYGNGEWAEAVELFSELAIEPEGVSGAEEMHWNMAMCYAHLDDMEKAKEHVGASGFSIADFDDQFARSKLALANGLYQQERWADAASAFTDLLILPGLPSDGMQEVHWNMGMCFARLGDWDRALGHATALGGNANEFRQACIDGGMNPPNPT